MWETGNKNFERIYIPINKFPSVNFSISINTGLLRSRIWNSLNYAHASIYLAQHKTTCLEEAIKKKAERITSKLLATSKDADGKRQSICGALGQAVPSKNPPVLTRILGLNGVN
jgi:hypothetical protein